MSTTIAEAAAAKRKLEADLLALLRAFQNSTGLVPAAVELQTVTRLGDKVGAIWEVNVRCELQT